MSNISSIINGATGSAQGREGTTVETFVLSLAAGLILFSVQFSAFAIFRNYLWAKRIYQPRSFLIPLKNRVKPPPANILKWLVSTFQIPAETEVLQKAGMDAYFFLRYLSMCLKIFLPLALVILPILIPLNVVDGKYDNTINTVDSNGTIVPVTYNVTGLDRLAWSNVSPEHTDRYWAHLILAIGVIAWTCYCFHGELVHYIIKRQEYLGSPSHRLKASSTTVLITDIPLEICTVEALTEIYDDLPGGIRRIWINKNLQKLAEKDEARREIENILEIAETKMLQKIVKQDRKQKKRDNNRGTDSTTATNEMLPENKTPPREQTHASTIAADCEIDLRHDLESHAVWTRHIGWKKRQTTLIPKPGHKGAAKTPLFGRFFCERIDTIYYCRRELARLNEEVEKDIAEADSCDLAGSAFIQFNTQKAAHLACQAVAATRPRQMLQRTVEMSPADINWPALNYSWVNRSVRLVVFLLLFLLVIVGFALISFATGILSRASTLADSTSWLRWIGHLPSWLISFIQGTVPPFVLVIVLSGPTPIVLRAMTNGTRGAITGSQGERSLQLWYFVFLLLEVFLIPTISSGLTSIVQEVIENATSVPQILATNLPTASNYYFSFLIVQALSISASSIFQTVRMLNYFVFGHVKTPDGLFQKLTFTHLTRIGSNIPWYTTFAVIGLVYAVIAPLILPFMLLTFGLYYIVIKNNVLYVIRTGNVDSGGLWFPHAIKQTFTGLYFMEGCLIGLFFLVRDVQNNVACKSHGIIMAVCLVATVFYQIWLTRNFHGLLKYAPLRLEGLAAQHDKEYELQRLVPSMPALGDSPVIVNEDRDEKGEKTTIDKSEKKPDTPQSSTKSDTLTTQRSRTLSEPAHNPPNRRRSSLQSFAIASRAKDMQANQQQDKERAKVILARLNRPLDEVRLQALESHLTAVEATIGNVLLPRHADIEARMMNDPVSKIIMQHHDEMEDLTPEERDMLISVAFTHPLLREKNSKPAVWIPRDDLGVSDDEIARTRVLSPMYLNIDNRGAYFNRKVKVEIDRQPPDMSEFALVMAEL